MEREERGEMIAIQVTFADGYSLITNMNGTIEEARAYYIGQAFNFGDTEEHPADHLIKAIAVEEVTP
jgi:hypothetical protein